MNRRLTVRKTVSHAVILLVSLMTLLVAADISFAAYACNQCHGNPPADGARTSGTGSSSLVGNHTNHVFGAGNSATALNVCTKCHGAAASSYTAAHSAYTSVTMSSPYVNMASKLDGYSAAGHGRARYNKGTFNGPAQTVFFNQTSIPVLSTCTTSDCHFERRTPVWGATAFSSPTDCNKCHGAPPAGVANANPLLDYTGGAAGSHTKHDLYYTGVANGCIKCHTDHTADASKFAHATSGRSGHSLVVSVKDPANVQDGSYSRTTTYPTYYPSAAGSITFGTCATSYCHSQGNAPYVAPVAVPTWGTANITCASCHKGSGGTGMDSGTYGHLKHVQTYGITCQRCHDATVTGNSTIKSYADHVDKLVTVKFYQNRSTALNGATYNGTAAYSAKVTHAPTVQNTPPTTASCTAVYCHSTGRSATDFTAAAFKPLSTPYWGKALAGCKSCHGGNASNGFKMLSSGSHKRHIANVSTGYAFGCVQCHNQTVSSDVVISNPANHANFGINVAMTAGTYNGGVVKLPGSAYANCASVTCHGDGKGGFATQAWGAGVLSCTACHGNGTGTFPAGTTDLSTPHTNHVSAANINSLGTVYACVDCHAYTVNSSNALINNSVHDNALVDYSGARAGKMAAFAYTAGKTCSVSYCHSTGKKGIAGLPAGAEPSSPAWQAGSLDCKACHGAGTGNGTFVSAAGEPNYSTARIGGSAAANSHKKHVAGASDCVSCHQRTTTTGTTLISGTALHTDKNINVNFSRLPYGAPMTNYSGNYTPASKTCANTYCHGAASTPGWGSNSLTCDTCHSASPGVATGTNRYWNAYSSSHKQHIEVTTVPTTYAVAAANNSTAALYNFSCTACHSNSAGAAHAQGAVSATQAAQVFFGFTTVGRKGPYAPGTARGTTDNGFVWTAGTCANIYCHSDGNGGNPKVSTFNWGTKNNSLRCYACHGSQDIKNGTAQTAGNYSSIRTNAHARHVRPDINTELGYGNGIDCARCHNATVNAALNSYSTVASGVLIKNRHVNKLRDYSGAFVSSNPTGGGSSGQFNATSHTCSNVYCHSNSKVGTPIGYYKSPAAWNSGVANQKCNYCHGSQTLQPRRDSTNSFTLYSSTGVPNYATTGLGTYSANSHRAHVTGLGTTVYQDTQVCYNCHAATLDSTTGVNVKFRPYSSRHANGGYNVRIKPALGASTYTASSKTCSVAACHGVSTPQWGGKANCQDCHGNGATKTVESYGANFWKDGALTAKIQMTGPGSWASYGHGRALGTYSSGRPAAAFSNVTNQCEYCHDSTVTHKDDTNVFRLKNFSTATFGRNAPCLVCHSASATGVNLGAGNKIRTTSTAIEADHFGGKHSATYNGGQFCWDCHNAHGSASSNWYMLRNNPAKVSDRTTGAPTTQTTTAVVFRTISTTSGMGKNFAKSGAPWNGICNVCHTYSATPVVGQTNHYGDSFGDGHNSGTTCTSCHSHTGSSHGTDAFAGAGGGCNGCHDFEVTGSSYTNNVWSGGSWGKAGTDFGNYVPTSGIAEGWGAHAKHINHIKTRLSIATAMDPTTQTFGSGVAGQVCGTCHTITNNTTQHNTSATGATLYTGRSINFNDNTYKLGPAAGTFLLSFGGSNPVYNGVSGTPSATTAKTCSNLSCHYFTSPNWSTY